MNSYQRGFMNKCAEYGVDPRHLIKYAQHVFQPEIDDQTYQGLNPSQRDYYKRSHGNMWKFHGGGAPGEDLKALNDSVQAETPYGEAPRQVELSGVETPSGDVKIAPAQPSVKTPAVVTPPSKAPTATSPWARLANHVMRNKWAYGAAGVGIGGAALASYLAYRARKRREEDKE